MANPPTLLSIQERVWGGRLPLEIVLDPSECRTFDQCDPYLISYPRLAYLPFLLPRLHAFFFSSVIDPETSQPHLGWFSFESVPLKWHCPVGLLYDVYSGAEPISRLSGGGGGGTGGVAETNPTNSILSIVNRRKGAESQNGRETATAPLPWRLTLHFQNWPDEDLVRLDAAGMVMHDAFINSVKEADYVRNGNGNNIMSLSKEHSAGLWQAVQDHDLPTYQRITKLLLPAANQPFKQIPVRIFLPLPPHNDSGTKPSLKVVQSPVSPTITASTSTTTTAAAAAATATPAPMRTPSSPSPSPLPQTVGSALHTLLPNLFPSRRIPVLAKPVLHGVVLPMTAPIEEVVRSSAYADGWIAIVVCMVG